MTKYFLALTVFCILLFTSDAAAQLDSPRVSNRQDLVQTIGDTKITVSYHRPNVRGRQVWGEGNMVPYNQVWRTGANEATLFETSEDIIVQGEKLPKGKYSLHTIPTSGEWTIIFNKQSDQWGSFRYDESQDQLRVTAKAAKAPFTETMTISFENAVDNKTVMHITWENVTVPVTLDIGDFNARFFKRNADRITAERVALARYVLAQQLKSEYDNAVLWIDDELSRNRTFPMLSLKAQLLAASGKRNIAITVAEEAIAFGQSAAPAVNTAQLEAMVKTWKDQQ